jgi:hypothetical protein
VEDQFMANLGTVLVMLLLVVFLYVRGEFGVFREHFAPPPPNRAAKP